MSRTLPFWDPETALLAGRIFRMLWYVSIAGLIFCLAGLGLAIRRHAPLWIGPLRAEGQVIGFREATWQSQVEGSPRTEFARLPVVQFRDARNLPRTFTDSMAHGEVTGQAVPVLYGRNDPSRARIDRGLLNFLEPGIWLFGTLGSLLAIRRFSQLGALRAPSPDRKLAATSSP